jgi:hypothetical protein
MKLDPRTARELTDRECSKIIGGMIGGLMTMARSETVRAAMRWWVDSDEAWQAMEGQLKVAKEHALRMAAEIWNNNEREEE